MHFKRSLSRRDYVIIAANLVPVLGVWFLGWKAVDVFIVYALETMIIGIMTVIKLLIASLFKGKDTWYNKGQTQQVGGLFFILFFVIHFGIFAAVQCTIFSQSAGITPPGSGPLYFFLHWYDYVNLDILCMLGAFVISYAVTTLIPFITEKEYMTLPMMALMFQPYGRVFIQQVVVILGSMFLQFGWNKGFILVFALVKICFEVYFNVDAIIRKAIHDLKKDSGQE